MRLLFSKPIRRQQANSLSSHWLPLLQIVMIMSGASPKLPSKQVGARKPPWLSKNTREDSNSSFGAKRPGLSYNLRLVDLHSNLDLGWIYLHG